MRVRGKNMHIREHLEMELNLADGNYQLMSTHDDAYQGSRAAITGSGNYFTNAFRGFFATNFGYRKKFDSFDSFALDEQPGPEFLSYSRYWQSVRDYASRMKSLIETIASAFSSYFGKREPATV